MAAQGANAGKGLIELMCVIGTSQELDKALRWYQALGTLETLMKRGATVRLELQNGVYWRCIVTDADGERFGTDYDELGNALAAVTRG